MSRIKKVLVMALLLVVVGMIAAENWIELVERHEKALIVLFRDTAQYEKDIATIYHYMACLFFAGVICTIVFFGILLSHGSKLDSLQMTMRRLDLVLTSNEELLRHNEALIKHNRDLIDRHEEMLKVLMLKSGSATTQNIVLQQPKPIAKPSNQIVEFNPNSQDDQTWLAKQKRRPQ